MAVRNSNLSSGASNWGNEVLTATDFNDTFNAAYDMFKQKIPFWINPSYYTAYDTFDSSVSATLWATGGARYSPTNGAGYLGQWTNSSDAGSGGALFLSTNRNASCSATTLLLPNNKRAYHMSIYAVGTSSGYGATYGLGCGVIINGTAYSLMGTVLKENSNTHASYTNLTLVNTSGNNYDIYSAGKYRGTQTMSSAGFTVYVQSSTSNTNGGIDAGIFVDSIVYTNED